MLVIGTITNGEEQELRIYNVDYKERHEDLIFEAIQEQLPEDHYVVDIQMRCKPIRNIYRKKDNEYKKAERVLSAVAQACDVEAEDLKKPDGSVRIRRRELSNARHIAAHYMCIMTELSLGEIGKIMGGRHHSTIINSRNQHQILKQTDYAFKELSKEVHDILKPAI